MRLILCELSIKKNDYILQFRGQGYFYKYENIYIVGEMCLYLDFMKNIFDV